MNIPIRHKIFILAFMIGVTIPDMGMADSKCYGKAKLEFYNSSSSKTVYVSTSGCDIDDGNSCTSDGSFYECQPNGSLSMEKGSGCDTSTVTCSIFVYPTDDADMAIELGFFAVSSGWVWENQPNDTALDDYNLTFSTDQHHGSVHCVVDLSYPVYIITLSDT